MNVELTQAERNLLEAILQEHQRVLLLEIAHADHKDYRLKLRENERLLESLIEKFGVGQRV
jgi:hypothetical protein